jgi:hypothetical protein
VVRVITDVSEGRISSIIKVQKLKELGTLDGKYITLHLCSIMDFEEWCLLGCYAVWLL